MDRTAMKEEQKEALWVKARTAGMPRRKFLVLLAAGGATAALAACTPKVTPTPVTTPTPSTTPERLVDEPVPDRFFTHIGGGNYEMRFEDMLDQAYVTPNSLFYVRNHTSTPVIDVTTWKLSIEGDGVTNPLTLTYDDLFNLPSKTLTRYVECAGNGRSFFDTELKKEAQGGQWKLGAYGIAEWVGVPMNELLSRAGIKSSAVDVMPVGLDSTQVARPMPVARAMEDDTILAYMMNGDILPLDHGFPARVLVPGWVGVSCIKWVGKIVVSTMPLYTDKNTTSYVLVGPDYQAEGQALGPPVTAQVMKSALCLPWPATLKAGPQKVVGYAWSPDGKIAKVDVSLDGGGNFQPATLVGPNIERAGSRWEFSFTANPGDLTITPRATDDRGNVQYPASQQKWNQMGYLFGATVPHPVTVTG
jgi:DMSO/TMAO reductase YedYZ molybdopterin-dependent catalytic subunit